MKYELDAEKFQVTITNARGEELIHACGSIHLRANLAALVASVVGVLADEPTKPEEPKPEEPKPEEPKPEEPKPEEPRLSLDEILRYRANGVWRNAGGSPQAMRVGDALVFHNGTLPPNALDDILRAINNAKQS